MPDPAFWRKSMFTSSLKWNPVEGEAEHAQRLSHRLGPIVDRTSDPDGLAGKLSTAQEASHMRSFLHIGTYNKSAGLETVGCVWRTCHAA